MLESMVGSKDKTAYGFKIQNRKTRKTENANNLRKMQNTTKTENAIKCNKPTNEKTKEKHKRKKETRKT